MVKEGSKIKKLRTKQYKMKEQQTRKDEREEGGAR
jgi:hypothetical protein